jgi:hypothetical protein
MSSRLLQLPAELRKHIYEHALTNPEGLPWKCLFNTEGGPANSLKLVCRQLHAETAGLELKYNAITFHQTDRGDDDPGIKLRYFADGIAPSKLNQIRTIIASTPADNSPPNNRTPLRLIADFCRANEHITFKFVTRAWSYRKRRGNSPPKRDDRWDDLSITLATIDVREFFDYGTLIQGEIRGTWSDLYRSGTAADERRMQEMLRYWDEQEDVQSLQAPNLRFWPAETCVDDALKIAIRYAVERNMIMFSFDDALGLFEMWVTEGIRDS